MTRRIPLDIEGWKLYGGAWDITRIAAFVDDLIAEVERQRVENDGLRQLLTAANQRFDTAIDMVIEGAPK